MNTILKAFLDDFFYGRSMDPNVQVHHAAPTTNQPGRINDLTEGGPVAAHSPTTSDTGAK